MYHNGSGELEQRKSGDFRAYAIIGTSAAIKRRSIIGLKTTLTSAHAAALATLLCLTATLSPLTAHASAETTTIAEDTLSGSVELGYLVTGGTTSTESLNAAIALEKTQGSFRHRLKADALYTEEEGTATTEQYTASLRERYFMTGRQYLFVRGTYIDNHFSGYEYEVSESAGYGIAFAPAEWMEVSVEAGPGGRHSKRESDRGHEDEAVIYASVSATATATDGVEISEETFTEVDEERTITVSETALKTTLFGAWAMKATYHVRHDSSPPAGQTGTDTLFTLTLVYNF